MTRSLRTILFATFSPGKASPLFDMLTALPPLSRPLSGILMAAM